MHAKNQSPSKVKQIVFEVNSSLKNEEDNSDFRTTVMLSNLGDKTNTRLKFGAFTLCHESEETKS